MKRLSLIVFLVCLMSNSVFASWFWMQADESIPPWAATDNWTESNQWDIVQVAPAGPGPGPPPLITPLEIKMMTEAWMAGTAHCTIDSNVGSYAGVNTTVSGNMYIKSGANIGFNRPGSKNGLRVGSAHAGGTSTTGTVEQTAGTVSASNLYLGYGGTMAFAPAAGYYVISGDSLLTIMDDPTRDGGAVHTGGLSVGSGINQASSDTIRQTIGKFVVIGDSPTINVTSLVVGGNIETGNPGTDNRGTLEFKLTGGVSPINCTSVYLDGGDINSTTNLVVSLMDWDVPPPIIVLVKNKNIIGNAVNGTFDMVYGDQDGGRALEGDRVVLLTPLGTPYYYRMSYTYNAAMGTFGNGNDIALIPEPATIALFGLGLLAVVRRPRRK